MSVQATSWVWEHSQSEGVNRLVALAVADAANREGRMSYQSVATIAAMTRTSERTVQRALRELEAAGEVACTQEAGRHKPRTYAFPGVLAGAPGLSPIADSGVTDDALRGDKTDPELPLGVTKTASRGDNSVTRTQDPSKKTPENPDDPLDADAREVLGWWWDQLDIKPAGRNAYFSALATVKALLKVGHTKRNVARALQDAGTPVTPARLEIALQRVSGTKRGNFREANQDHWAQGGEF